jgi:two-component system, NarL family, invasion response regulator UvrY
MPGRAVLSHLMASHGPNPLPAAATSDVRVMTVDDQERFRGVARDVIEATPGFRYAGEAASGEEALREFGRIAPELVLVDVRMPGIDGIEVARRLHESSPETVVVLISIEEPADLPSVSRLTGGVPLVRKQDFGPRLLRRIWKEYGGSLAPS